VGQALATYRKVFGADAKTGPATSATRAPDLAA
jgi:hypothetical protein